MRNFRPEHNPLLTRAVAVLLGIGILCLGWWLLQRSPSKNPQLDTPVLAVTHVSQLHPTSLYFNAPALPWLPAGFPGLDAARDRIKAMGQAALDPATFRKLDRKHRFDTLLLTGDPSQYRPLLDHLMDTKDWIPVYLDHTSLVFQRGASPWEPKNLEPMAAGFEDPGQRSKFLALASTKALGIRMPKVARDLLDQATKLDPKNLDTCYAAALYHMSRGEWPLAMNQINRALEADPDYLPAIASKAQVLYSTKRFNDALNLSRKVLDERPEDPSILFYHAKIAHEAHAYEEEIRVLKKLADIADRDGFPSSGYRIYLGQAHATVGDAKPAVAELTKALADPDLSPEQRKFAEEMLTQIKSRSGL